MIDLLVVLSNKKSGPVAEQLVNACARMEKRSALFITGDAAELAGDKRYDAMFQSTGTAIVCAESWDGSASEQKCLVQLGSQTDHSRLAGEADKIMSL
jgi:hypothetical protein